MLYKHLLELIRIRNNKQEKYLKLHLEGSIYINDDIHFTPAVILKEVSGVNTVTVAIWSSSRTGSNFNENNGYTTPVTGHPK